MATVTLAIPDELLKRVRSRLSKRGKADIEDFLINALESLTVEGKPVDAVTEKKLLEALESPAIQLDDAAWAAKLANYDKRHRGRKRA
jgi:hypothetical protein